MCAMSTAYCFGFGGWVSQWQSSAKEVSPELGFEEKEQYAKAERRQTAFQGDRAPHARMWRQEMKRSVQRKASKQQHSSRFM